MEFSMVGVRNFLTIGSATLQLSERGLHLIQGQNDDDGSASSNGAGKSSLTDAICWALYGVTARGVKGDAVVNRTAKKDTSVQVQLVNGATTYVVNRYRKHSTEKNKLALFAHSGGTVVDMTKGTDAETQKEVERVIGCSYEVFMSAVYLGQEMMPDLPRMTDKQLKTLIEEAAGLERIERAYGVARDRMTATEKELAAVVSKLNVATTAHANGHALLTTVLNQRDEWADQQHVRVNDLAKEIIVQSAKIVDESNLLTKARSAFQAAVDRLKEIEAQLAGFEAQKREATKARNAASAADRAVDRTGLQYHKNLRDQAQAALDNAEVEMSKPCSECGKPHTEDELEQFKQHLGERLKRASDALKVKGAQVALAARDALAAKNHADALEAALPDVSAITTESGELLKVVSAMERAESLLKTLKDGKVTLENQRAKIAAEVNPHLKTEANIRAQIDAAFKDIEAYEKQRDELLTKLEVDKLVVKVYGPAGVRAQILDSVTPFLNDRTADYLSALSDGNLHATWTTLTRSASGDLKEKFSIDVSNDKGADSFPGLSGGEKRKVRLACALALQDLVASRATQPIKLWIADEPDDALDPAGLERLMGILERKARERGTVLVISHSDLRDWIDNVTIVRKSGGQSEVEGALCV